MPTTMNHAHTDQVGGYLISYTIKILILYAADTGTTSSIIPYTASTTVSTSIGKKI